MDNSEKGRQDVNITGSTVGAVGGHGSTFSNIHVNDPATLEHPQAAEVAAKINELEAAIRESNLPAFKQQDALNGLAQLRETLEQKETPDRQEGVRYYLNKILFVVENVTPLVEIGRALGKVLGVPV